MYKRWQDTDFVWDAKFDDPYGFGTVYFLKGKIVKRLDRKGYELSVTYVNTKPTEPTGSTEARRQPPEHYPDLPCGVPSIEMLKGMDFIRASIVKYIYRLPHKYKYKDADGQLADIEKIRYLLDVLVDDIKTRGGMK